MASAWVRALSSTAIFCSVTLIATGCGQTVTGPFNLDPDTESYVRPLAETVPSADCAAPDIANTLSDNGMGHFGGGAAPSTAGMGSVPTGFTTKTIVLCERAVDAAGNVAIDAVTLGGDVAELARALDRPSEREVGNSISSCASVRMRRPDCGWCQRTGLRSGHTGRPMSADTMMSRLQL